MAIDFGIDDALEDISEQVRQGRCILFLGSAVHARPPSGSPYTYPPEHRPAMAEAVRKAVAGGRYVGQEFRPAPEPFAGISGESVDYAVMENTARAAVVPAEMGWSDIGNWEALRDARPGDHAGNRTLGEVELVDCRNVLVETDGPRVSVIGLEDVIVVVDNGEVLVTSAAGAQLVGKLSGAANQ